MKERVLIIGLDGATFKLIKPWVKEGKLPTFARLMEEGAYGELKSTPDMMSPAAWTSFFTGKNPAKHGIYNFLDLIPGTLKMRYLNSTHRDGETLWSLLNKAGKKAGVLNVPMTYPAEKVNGFMISGWNAPTIRSKRFSYPPYLINELLERFGEYALFPTVKKNIARGRPDLGIEELHHDLNLKDSISRYLMEKEEWDIFISFFVHTDQVQHYYWHYMDPQHPKFNPKNDAEKYGDAIFSIYKRCDQIIHDHISSLDDDVTIIVVSDHGQGPNHGAVQYLPLWLKYMGLAKDREVSSKNPINMLWLWMSHNFSNLLKWTYNQMNKRLSIKYKSYLNTLFPNLRDKIESAWRFSTYDWSKTKVYFHYEPRINLKGREPYGIILPGKEYEDLRDYLIKKLYECRDLKTGQKVVEKVFKGEEVFHGKYLANAPDIVIWWKEDVVISGLVSTREDGTEIKVMKKHLDDPRTGNHTPYGIFIAKGKHIKKGVEVKGAEIIDLAPTILYLMGVPIPKDMDGKVLIDIFNDSFLRENLITYTEGQSDKDSVGDGYSDTDEEKVHEHLKALGYIE